MNKVMLKVVIIVLACTNMLMAEKTKIPYLEAINLQLASQPSPAIVQQELVMLKAQARITGRWVEVYRRLFDLYSLLQRNDLALKTAEKIISLERDNAMMQLQTAELELQNFQTSESACRYLKDSLKNKPYLLPEVRSDLCRQLAEWSYENYDYQRAKRYLQLSLKHTPQNLKSYQLLYRIANDENNKSETMLTEMRMMLAGIMINPFDAVDMRKIANIAGQAGNAKLRTYWLNRAESVKSEFAKGQSWPKESTSRPSNLPSQQIVSLIRKFDKRFTALASTYKTSLRVKLSCKGDMENGEIPELTIKISNLTDIPMTIGPSCFIEPLVRIRVVPIPTDKQIFLLNIPIESRQILPPRKSIILKSLLEQSTDPAGLLSWDKFIATREPRIGRIKIQAEITSTALLPKPIPIVLAESNSVNISLPKIDAKAALIMINRLKKDGRSDFANQARLIRWMLISRRLKDKHRALSAALTGKISRSTDSDLLVNLCWAQGESSATPGIINNLAQKLNHPDWKVRLFALDSIVKIQKRFAGKIVRYYSVHDKDALVRQLAASYLLY